MLGQQCLDYAAVPVKVIRVLFYIRLLHTEKDHKSGRSEPEKHFFSPFAFYSVYFDFELAIFVFLPLTHNT